MKPLNEINKKNNYAIVDISNKITTYVASCKAEMKPETSSAPTPKPIITKPVTAKFKVLHNNQSNERFVIFRKISTIGFEIVSIKDSRIEWQERRGSNQKETNNDKNWPN